MLPPVQGQVQGHHHHRGTLPTLPAVPQDSETSLGYEETSDSLEGSRGPGPRTQHGRCLCLSVVQSGVCTVCGCVSAVVGRWVGQSCPPLMSSFNGFYWFLLILFIYYSLLMVIQQIYRTRLVTLSLFFLFHFPHPFFFLSSLPCTLTPSLIFSTFLFLCLPPHPLRRPLSSHLILLSPILHMITNLSHLPVYHHPSFGSFSHPILHHPHSPFLSAHPPPQDTTSLPRL